MSFVAIADALCSCSAAGTVAAELALTALEDVRCCGAFSIVRTSIANKLHEARP
jgi:hypothetical protein